MPNKYQDFLFDFLRAILCWNCHLKVIFIMFNLIVVFFGRAHIGPVCLPCTFKSILKSQNWKFWYRWKEQTQYFYYKWTHVQHPTKKNFRDARGLAPLVQKVIEGDFKSQICHVIAYAAYDIICMKSKFKCVFKPFLYCLIRFAVKFQWSF